MLDILKRLGFGLITVADTETGITELVLEAEENKVRSSPKKKSLEKELRGRNCDINVGGSKGRKLVTAYLEHSIKALCYGEKQGGEFKTRNISDCSSAVRSNYYGWFERIGRGEYRITEKGFAFLSGDEFTEVLEYYKKCLS